jgi:hypothetical protein
MWVGASDGVAGHVDHGGEFFPAGIDFEIPMRFVVRLVPKHCGFDHTIAEFGLRIAAFTVNSDAMG